MVKRQNYSRGATKVTIELNPETNSEAFDSDVRAAFEALKRSAQMARKIAMQTDTDLVIVRDGCLLHISAEELRQRYDRHGAPKS